MANENPLHKQSAYKIRVKTGDRKKAGSDADISIRLHDETGASTSLMKLDVWFRDDFERGQLNEFEVESQEAQIGNVSKIELQRNSAGIFPDWYADYVEVEDRKTHRVFVFPIHRWVPANRPVFYNHLDALLPQHDAHRDQREAELEAKRKVYEYARHGPGLPVMVKNFPDDEKFSDNYQYEWDKLRLNLIGSLIIIKLLNGAGRFKSIKDVEKLYGKLKAIDIPRGLAHWRKDSWFGAQRVMGCNPVLIKLCTALPESLGVTGDMVKPFLEGQTLDAAIKKKKIYICDLKVLEGIDGHGGLKVCQPIAMFYANKKGSVKPIAIQLFQEKSCSNPVFLPSDKPHLWQLVKMWYNVADATHHQALTHLAFTHLKAEGVAVCSHRNLSPSHPVFRLLAPHFINIMAINVGAVQQLLAPSGPIDNTIAVGSAGFSKLIGKRQEEWRLDLDGHLPNDLRARGVDDPVALPFYPYRDDGLLTWNAIWRYVESTLDLYYDDDTMIKEDPELQRWAHELTASFEEGGIGMSGVPGRGKFTTKGELVETVTCIIFMCSVRHAAANFSQYDDYAFSANYPSHLNGDPPSDKKGKKEQDLVDALPSKSKTIEMIAVAKTLSLRGTNALGDFEVRYLYDERAKKIATRFREELIAASKEIAKRNKTRKYKSDILDPGFIPNSISI